MTRSIYSLFYYNYLTCITVLNYNREQRICHEHILFYYKTVHISMLTICTQLYKFKNTIKKETNRQ